MVMRNQNASRNGNAGTAGSPVGNSSNPVAIHNLCRQHAQKSLLGDDEEKNPCEEAIGQGTRNISNMLLHAWNALYDRVLFPIKRVLYKTSKNTTINDECERLSPKTLVIVSGIILVLVSVSLFSVQIIPQEVIDITIPGLLFVHAIPIPVSIMGFLLGVWMTASHPKKGRGHGIIDYCFLTDEPYDVKEARKRDTIENKLFPYYQKMYASMLDLLYPSGKSLCKHALWDSECEGVDAIVKALTFEHVDVPSFSYFSKKKSEQGKMTEDEIQAMIGKYKEATKAFADVMQIWRASFAFGQETRFVIYEVRPWRINDTLDDITRVGRAMGIEDAVNAYMAGVPIEDVLA